MGFRKGQVVQHKKLVFSDNVYDIKIGRPSIVLYVPDNSALLLTCPLTTKQKLNKEGHQINPLVYESLGNPKKLNFAKIRDINFRLVENIIPYDDKRGGFFTEDLVDYIIDRFLRLESLSEEQIAIQELLQKEKEKKLIK